MSGSDLHFRSLVMDGHRVLRRTDRSADLPFLLVGYDDTQTAAAAVHPDGVRAATVFSRSPGFVARFTKLGWTDVTDLWVESGSATSAPAVETTPAEPPKRKRTSTRRAVRRSVAG